MKLIELERQIEELRRGGNVDDETEVCLYSDASIVSTLVVSEDDFMAGENRVLLMTESEFNVTYIEERR
jgi:hypothetical protein